MRAAIVAVCIPALLVLGCDQGPASAAPTSSGAAHRSGAPSAGTEVKSARTYVIFADVTESLTAEEQQAVCDMVRKVVATIPAESQLYVFPILEDVPRSGALFEGKLPATMNTADRAYADALRMKWEREVEARVRRIDAGSPAGRLHTCISGALRKATEVVRPDAPTEIILVSDMLEDCPDSLLGGSLTLEKRSIQTELDRARHIAADTELLNLRGANITVLLATVPVTKPKVHRPPQHEVNDFWRAVLDHCRDNKENYYVGTQLPLRLAQLADSDS